jgi:hypothetical protein
MTMLQYAKVFGNMYTDAFAMTQRRSMAGLQPSGPRIGPAHTEPEDVQLAKSFLDNILVILEDDLRRKQPFAELGRLMHDEWLEDIVDTSAANAFPHHHTLSAEQIAELREVMKYDLELYDLILADRGPTTRALQAPHPRASQHAPPQDRKGPHGPGHGAPQVSRLLEGDDAPGGRPHLGHPGHSAPIVG